MKILYVSQYFPPEMGAPAARVSELAKQWAVNGHEVTVLTGFPNHPTGEVPSEYRRRLWRLVYKENMDGVQVVRSWLLPRPNKAPLDRILNYVSFFLSSSMTGVFLRRPDVIIATSPQLLVGLTGWWLRWIKRAPLVLEIRDLWPESLIGSGVGTKDSVLNRWIRRLANFLYRRSDHIAVVTSAMKEALVTENDIAPEKISVAENAVDTDLFTPDGGLDTLRITLGIEDRFVASYIGTLGLAHGLSIVLQAAAQLRNTFPEILFLFVGEGAHKLELAYQARIQGLGNVRFLPQQPREDIPDFIRASDVCLVPLKKANVFKTVVPTKMLEFMACARPVVLGVDGQAHQVLNEAQAGIHVEPENPEALVRAIKQLRNDGDLRNRFGSNGRRYVSGRLSRTETAKVYTGILEDVAKGRKRGAQPDIETTTRA